MNNTLVTISLLFCPFVIVLLFLGVHYNIKAIKDNQAIDLRYSKFKEAPVHVNKYIIQEKYYSRNIRGAQKTLQKPKYLYDILIDANYTVDLKEYKSFGRLAVVNSLDFALDRYKTIPGSPPIFYQQKEGYLRVDFLSILENFKKSTNAQNSNLTISYLPDSPKVNQLVTIDRRSYGLTLFFYIGSFIFSLLFLLFCALTIEKIGNVKFVPLLLCIVLALIFSIIKAVTYKPNIDITSFLVPYHNIELDASDTKANLSIINK